jgi:rare lipoprotein A
VKSKQILPIFVILLLSCGPSQRFASTPTPGDPTGPHEFSGRASYYSDEFHGRKTANGETFDMNALTAAHRTLPFNTILRVTNLENGREVTVRVNDRGPFVGERVIDLSLAAARELDLELTGTAMVRIEVLEMGESLK